MSSGHHIRHGLTTSELDDLLSHALADRRVKAELANPFKVVTNRDVPLLGSSAIGWRTVYFDCHLRIGSRPYATIMVEGRPLDVRPGLTRHERLEPILENIFGWDYGKLAHPVAQHWEEQDYIKKGFDPRKVEKAFAPFIRTDEREPLPKVPTDLDLRPCLSDEKLLARIRAAQNAQKFTQASHDYVAQSPFKNRRCDTCIKFVKPEYGGPACVKVQSPINAAGYCRRFERGKLDDQGF